MVGSVGGVGGPDVSKTEAIKASVAWVSSRNRAMAWCFRCVSGVLSVSRCMVPGLIASVLDTWRAHCAVPAPEQGCPRSEAGRGTRRRVRIVVNEGALRQHGAGADPRTGASSSGTKPTLKAAAPLTARTPAPGLRCEAPRGGATNRASHPRLLKTVNISPQNRHRGLFTGRGKRSSWLRITLIVSHRSTTSLRGILVLLFMVAVRFLVELV